MDTNGQMVERRHPFPDPAEWEDATRRVKEWKDRAVKHGPLPVLILYAINLILLALIVYGMYYGLQAWVLRDF